MIQSRRNRTALASTVWVDHPIEVCVLGEFLLLKKGAPVPVRRGGKTECLLANLALHPEKPIAREVLLDTVWPESEQGLASQSLNSLVYALRKQLSDVLQGSAPVLLANGGYCLNVEAGVGVDVAAFESMVNAGDQQQRMGNRAAAAREYARAVRLYRGDLCAGTDMYAVVERERLRASFLSCLAFLADSAYEEGDYAGSLAQATRLLAHDPCREDAHRMVMRCYMRRGERAEALRQFRRCAEILAAEFSAAPEPATLELFERIRLQPNSV